MAAFRRTSCHLPVIKKRRCLASFNDIISNCKFPTWRPAGCQRGRSRRSRGALRPQPSTCVSTNTRCSSSSDGPLTSDRRDSSAGRSSEVCSVQHAPCSDCAPLGLAYLHAPKNTDCLLSFPHPDHRRGCYTDTIAAIFFFCTLLTEDARHLAALHHQHHLTPLGALDL